MNSSPSSPPRTHSKRIDFVVLNRISSRKIPIPWYTTHPEPIYACLYQAQASCAPLLLLLSCPFYESIFWVQADSKYVAAMGALSLILHRHHISHGPSAKSQALRVFLASKVRAINSIVTCYYNITIVDYSHHSRCRITSKILNSFTGIFKCLSDTPMAWLPLRTNKAINSLMSICCIHSYSLSELFTLVAHLKRPLNLFYRLLSCRPGLIRVIKCISVSKCKH